jgi:hypothetical protein
MKRILSIIFLISLSSFIYAQEGTLIDELNKFKNSDEQVLHIMKMPVFDLESSKTIKILKKKLLSKLNTIYSCVNSFVNSKELKLSLTETNA